MSDDTATIRFSERIDRKVRVLFWMVAVTLLLSLINLGLVVGR